MTDSGLTPHVIVDAGATGVDVPKAHVREGRIVLNIGYEATRNIDLGNDWISFEARFGGVARQLRFPVLAVHSIYARETGEGIVFPPEESSPLPEGPAPDDPARPPAGTAGTLAGPPSTPPRRPSLKVVK